MWILHVDFASLFSDFFDVVSYLVSSVTLQHHSEGLHSEKFFKKELKLYGNWGGGGGEVQNSAHASKSP